MKIVEPYVKLLKFDNIYDGIEYATRNCYKSQKSSTPEKRDAFIYDKIERNHLSVLEHSNIPLVWNFSRDEIDDAVYIYQWLQAIKGESGAKVYISLSALQQSIIMSGNVRGWMDLFSYDIRNSPLFNEGFLDMLETVLSKEHPMFFLDRNILPVGDIRLTTEEDASLHSLEHATLSFEILTDRATSHQIVRHRVFSYAQESQRYCNYGLGKFGGDVSFIVDGNLENHLVPFFEVLSKAEENYLKLINDGVPPETARMVLPNATATTIVMSGRLLDFDEFVRKRKIPNAQGPIRKIAEEIDRIIFEQMRKDERAEDEKK